MANPDATEGAAVTIGGADNSKGDAAAIAKQRRDAGGTPLPKHAPEPEVNVKPPAQPRHFDASGNPSA